MNNTEELKTVQDRIRYLFKRSSETQPVFAAAIGIKQPHFSGIMKNRNPSRQLIANIAEHTGASKEWIAEGIGTPFPSEGESKDPEILKAAFDVQRGVWDSLDILSERLELAAKLIQAAKKFKKERAKPEAKKLDNPQK